MIKKILLGMTLLMSMVSCTEDYTDWANPQSNPDKEEAVSFGDGSVTPEGVINLADVTGDKVKVASIVAPTSTKDTYAPFFKINFDGQSFDIDADGNMAKADLVNYITNTYGKRPIERDIDATLDAWQSNGSTAAKVKMATSENFQVKAIPEAPFIDEGYYLVGDMFTTEEVNGWTKEVAKAFKHSEKDVYEDPIFTVSFETTKADQYWKIIPKKNIDSDDLWAAGVVGPKVDGDDSMTGLLTNGDAKAGKIAKAGKYKLTINMMDYSYTLEEVNYDPFIYFIGATDGWTNAEQKLALVDDAKGVYTGYLYCADPNGWGNQFKFQRVAGSYDNEINSGAFSTFSGAATSEGGNIGVNAGEGVYYFDVNLGEGTITATKVETMGMIGGFNEWAGDAPMKWNAEEYCFEATFEAPNAGVTADGWKFRVNGKWAINLGGSINNLTAGGDNITVAGKTVKLYPTRKTKDNIYCTVE
jgi:starch-binding outer membrane protein SusE/F